MDSVVNENYSGGEKESLKDVEAAHIEMSEFDDSKAAFIKKEDVDPTEVAVRIPSNTEFTGLTKEELMEYANNPFWTKLRLGLFILFWVGWIAMLAAAIIIIVLAPRCPHRPDYKWWQNEVMYQVYPQSFQDSTASKGEAASKRFDDGYGDLKGFESRLDYLKDLQANVVWMNSVFDQDAFGPLNHTKLSGRYGTIGELKRLLKHMHKKGMKLVFDFIPNHTSNNHTWFLKSRKKSGKYADYYVWKACADDKGNAPSNWRDVYGGGAWKKDAVRGECYYHSFLEEQPDLNLRNGDVKMELKAVLEYWMKLGVDGVHVNDAAYLVESEKAVDEPEIAGMEGYNGLVHNATLHQPETVTLIKEWNKIINVFSKPGREKLLFTTMPGDANTTSPYFGTSDKPGVNFIPSQAFYNLNNSCSAGCYRNIVKGVLAGRAMNLTGGWRLGDQNNPRVASIVARDILKSVHALQLLLPGPSINYYGDEIGLRNTPLDYKDVVDPAGLKAGADNYTKVYHDQFRTPMRWDGSKLAGFTKGKPWLPLTTVDQPNVQEHAAKFADESLIAAFKAVSKLRREPSFLWGETKWSINDDYLLSFVRIADGFPAYLVAINFGVDEVNAKFSAVPADTFSDKMEVVHHSARKLEDKDKEFNPHETAVSIKGGETIIFKFELMSSE